MLVLTLVGWMSGKGSRDSGMNTTTISFLAFHSFLNRSILAAASNLMGDPGLWVGTATIQQNRVWKSQTASDRGGGLGEGVSLLAARKGLFWLCVFTHTPWTVTGPVCVSARWVTLPEFSFSNLSFTSTASESRAMHYTAEVPLLLCLFDAVWSIRWGCRLIYEPG